VKTFEDIFLNRMLFAPGAGRRSEQGGRMAHEREYGRSRDSEAGSHRGSLRERSSDSGFRSDSSSHYPSGHLPPMGSSGLPLSPSQGPMPGGEPALSSHLFFQV